MGRTSNEGKEARRRAWCRERARLRFHVLNNGRRPFPAILAAIRRRWPVSAAGDDFAAELLRLYEREETERATWLRELAQRCFSRWHHPRWQFSRLEKYVRLRKPRLAKDPVFAAELRRLFDAANVADLQPHGRQAPGPDHGRQRRPRTETRQAD